MHISKHNCLHLQLRLLEENQHPQSILPMGNQHLRPIRQIKKILGLNLCNHCCKPMLLQIFLIAQGPFAFTWSSKLEMNRYTTKRQPFTFKSLHWNTNSQWAMCIKKDAFLDVLGLGIILKIHPLSLHSHIFSPLFHHHVTKSSSLSSLNGLTLCFPKHY